MLRGVKKSMRAEGHCRTRVGTAICTVAASVLVLHLDGSPAAGVDIGSGHRTAPNFARVDLERRQVSLADYRGKVVLLNFWATWCAPCLAEVLRFAEWQRTYGGPGALQVIGVSMDDQEPPVRAAYQKYGLNYPVVMGDESLGELYGGVLGLPITFLIDRQGKIRFKHRGLSDLDVMKREIQQLLSGQ